MASACDGKPTEKECGGTGRLLALHFTCDPAAAHIADVAIEEADDDEPYQDALFDQHNPSYSFAMRIDVVIRAV
eukprot:COSAG02_NODE_530_length_20697_cov_20.103457_1_plen_74_part_10